MLTQRRELVKQIEFQGWRATQLEGWEVEDWADEIWLLESVWSPLDARAYLTFLVDNMISDWNSRKKGESVWAAELTLLNPRDELQDENRFLMSLNQGWEKEIPAMLKHLSRLREKCKEA